MSKVLVFGHQNPDTDAIASSYAFAYLAKNAYKMDAEVVALGEPNEETAFALDYFGVTAPRVVESAKEEGVDTVILTDHNEFQQSLSDISDVTIFGVVDHHRVANFETANPLFMRVEPVGSASSIVYRMYKENNLEVPKEIAGLLLSGLISDTLLLKSPTTHMTDHKVAEELANLAGVNLEEYGMSLLKAGTNLASKSEAELIDIDAKTFELNGNAVRVAQVNTVDIAEVLERQDAIETAISDAIVKEGYSDFVLMITDIVNSNSEILALGSNMDKVEAAFNFKLENNHAFLPGAVSRKKQVVPQLTESFGA
ncbi:manganese-dependent inorganic pyrophosphatase [Streptococcus uberis]|uniref:manganese-dependent inorganic pyrophosphatase n=1 Tax=Streptococcus uberis TaxID=1349 RepID=UPI001FF420ED|nr:manganese-dependent inorganic pyrophosphatase [Streptococcus uberis]MCK1159575.1 manganese-dependent inorganic pyrophosphatase [Streptococcus uberis]MCK1161352.1 manganese-dependent inorganic pyrophosphatase [Streptococcus uberis]MCK1165104.1 manganese-dependent inorganic pyrophosphatase [Streptococcus uberis]MCK1168967.1 manganese-dependent inorganic pyrophosphatase [Streptococcus uberis]MCK1186557.1 manganese-dependent inorganic pyrophosphatase [Streptococcus uberis]